MSKIKSTINKEISDTLENVKQLCQKQDFIPLLIVADKINLEKTVPELIKTTGELFIFCNPSITIQDRIKILKQLLRSEEENLLKLN